MSGRLFCRGRSSPLAATQALANLLFVPVSRVQTQDVVLPRGLWLIPRALGRRGQLVSHEAISVNGAVVNIPSYLVSATDVVAVVEVKNKHAYLRPLRLTQQVGIAAWVEVKTPTRPKAPLRRFQTVMNSQPI